MPMRWKSVGYMSGSSTISLSCATTESSPATLLKSVPVMTVGAGGGAAGAPGAPGGSCCTAALPPGPASPPSVIGARRALSRASRAASFFAKCSSSSLDSALRRRSALRTKQQHLPC